MSQAILLGGRYQLESVIGRGGMAEVWRARDSRLGRDVAVKRLRADLSSDPTFQARFRREAQAAAGLNHHNIVAVYDTGEQLDAATDLHVPYIVMELVQGHTLRDVLRDGRKILPERALEFVQGVLDALAYSHKAGIVHRDIKPANVMLTPQGQVKVMDFGIARAVADTSATMTQTAAVIGTAQYLSPEQARGETVDQRSDIYSAGCLLYELLVGRPPFTGDSPVSVAYQHVREQPVPPSQLDNEITPAMDAITLKALAKDPADRYQDAREFRDDIARLLAGEPVLAAAAGAGVVATPTSPASAAPTPVGAGGAGVAGAGVAAGALAAAAGAGLGAAAVASHASSTGAQSVVSDTGTFGFGTDAGTGTLAAVDDRPRRRGIIILVTVLAVALLAAVGFGLWQFFTPSSPPPVTQVKVPSVRGLNQAAAETTIVNANLKVGKVTTVNGPDDTKNTVIEQTPKAEQMVDPGTAVDFVVNLGVKTGTIPAGLVGKTEKEATDALKAAGFTVKSQVSPANADALAQKPGMVVSTEPSEGATGVPLGQQVIINLSPAQAPVPNLVGKSESDARSLAQDAGFPDITVRTQETSTPNEVGKVISQDPTDGSTADRTKNIVVMIGTAKSTIVVPTVTTMNVVNAQQVLASAGFTNVHVKYTETSTVADGQVLGVTPGEGTDQKPNTKITLEVAKAPASSPPTASDSPSAPTSSASSASSSPTGG